MPIENISPDIEKIKADGARKALGTAINDALWRIQGHSDDARKEEYKNFGQCIAKIKEDVAKAEALYAEWKRLG